MNQNNIKIFFDNQIKEIEKPKSLNKFKEKISNIFKIDENDLKNITINMKSPIELFIENDEIYNEMIFFSNLKNIVIEIIDLNNLKDYSCRFYENNKTLEIKLADLKRNDNRIEYIFKIQNNGQKPWPEDAFLKCVNDDSDIFFYHCSIGQVKNIDNIVYNEVDSIINFKNKYPNIGNYQCHAILMSDSKGQMGKTVGTLNIKIY